MMYDEIVEILIRLQDNRDASFEGYTIALRKRDRTAMAESLEEYHKRKKEISRISSVFVKEAQKASQQSKIEAKTFAKQIQ